MHEGALSFWGRKRPRCVFCHRLVNTSLLRKEHLIKCCEGFRSCNIIAPQLITGGIRLGQTTFKSVISSLPSVCHHAGYLLMALGSSIWIWSQWILKSVKVYCTHKYNSDLERVSIIAGIVTGKMIWLLTGCEPWQQRIEGGFGFYCNVNKSFHMRVRWPLVSVHHSRWSVHFNCYLRIVCVWGHERMCTSACQAHMCRDARNQPRELFIRCCPPWCQTWSLSQLDWLTSSLQRSSWLLLPRVGITSTAPCLNFWGSNLGPCSLYWFLSLSAYLTFLCDIPRNGYQG